MTESAGLLQRLRGAWRGMTDSFGGAVKPDLSSASDIDQLREQMRSCLEARGGEVSARGRAAGLGRTYLELDRKGGASGFSRPWLRISVSTMTKFRLNWQPCRKLNHTSVKQLTRHSVLP